MMIPLRNGEEYEIPADYLTELTGVYYGVEDEIRKMRLWCLSNPERCKTPRGVKRFIFNWISKSCTPIPKPATKPAYVVEITEKVSREARSNYLQTLKSLVKERA